MARVSPLNLFRLGFVALDLGEQSAAVAFQMPVALLVGHELRRALRFRQDERAKGGKFTGGENFRRFAVGARVDDVRGFSFIIQIPALYPHHPSGGI